MKTIKKKSNDHNNHNHNSHNYYNDNHNQHYKKIIIKCLLHRFCSV